MLAPPPPKGSNLRENAGVWQRAVQIVWLGGLLLFVTMPAFTSVSFAQDEAGLLIPENVQSILASRCIDCHSDDEAEAGVQFDNFSDLTQAAQLELLNRAQDQMFFGLMPPEDADQPSDDRRSLLVGWLRSELRKHNASKLDDKLRQPPDRPLRQLRRRADHRSKRSDRTIPGVAGKQITVRLKNHARI